MPQVKMPDGTLVDMPDNPTPEQLQRLRSLSEEPSFFESAVSRAKNLGTGLVKGFGSLATMAGDAMADDPQTRMAQAAANARQGTNVQPRVGDVSAMVAPMGYQPKNNRERIEQALASGVGGALFPGPGAILDPKKAALIGLSAAGGSELANAASGGNKAAAIAGGLAGGGVAGIAANLKGNTKSLAREALYDVNPKDLDIAQESMRAAQQAGVPVNLSQAMPKPSNIDALVNTLANARQGKKIIKQLRDQPRQVEFGMENELQNLPGSVRAPQIVANNLQEAATGVIDSAKRTRGDAWKQEYNAGMERLKQQAGDALENVPKTSAIVDESGAPIRTSTTVPAAARVQALPESAVAEAHGKLKAMAAERPNTGLGTMLDDLADRLKAKDGFITDAEQLNGVMKDVTARLKSPDLATKGVDAGGAKFLANTINDLREGFGEKFAPFREANTKFAQLTDELVNPAKKSVVGDIAGRRGALPDVEAVKGRINSVLDAGTVPGAKSSEILTLEKAVRAIPQSTYQVGGRVAFQDAVKTWMATKISDASRVVEGRVDPEISGNLHKVFMGTDTKAQGFKDMLVGLARSQSLPDNALVPGMEKFLKVVSMASRRPGSVQGLNTSGAAEIAGKTAITTGGQTTVNPFRNLALRWSDSLQAGAYSEMDRLLTTPEGVDMLKKLAKQPTFSPAAEATIATFLGTNAAMADNETSTYGK